MACLSTRLSILMFFCLVPIGLSEPPENNHGVHGDRSRHPPHHGRKHHDQILRGKGKGSRGKKENEPGFKRLKNVMMMLKKNKHGGFRGKVKEVADQCKFGDLRCLREAASNMSKNMSKGMNKFERAEFVRGGKRKQRKDICKNGFKTNGNVNISEMCPDCANLNGRKQKYCYAKCKKEVAEDLMEEKTEECMVSGNVSDCICTMDDEIWNITGSMGGGHARYTAVQNGLKKAVCGMFRMCVDSNESVDNCKTAAKQVIDDASCIKEGNHHIFERCMMHDLKAIKECSDEGNSECEARNMSRAQTQVCSRHACFKESLTSLKKRGFKKRQGKQLLAAQALQDAYEAFSDCNCTDVSVANVADCHAHAKEAFSAVRKIGRQLDEQYDKIKSKVEELAQVVCVGGETMVKLKSTLTVEFSEGGDVCQGRSNASDMTVKVAAEGFGRLIDAAICVEEFGIAYIQVEYNANGKTSEQINKAADNIVTHFSSYGARRLVSAYDEVYADQGSEEVPVPESSEESVEDENSEEPVKHQGMMSDSARLARTNVSISMAVVALIFAGHVMSNAQ